MEQLLLQRGEALEHYKVGPMLLQSGAALMYHNVGQMLLQSGATFLNYKAVQVVLAIDNLSLGRWNFVLIIRMEKSQAHDRSISLTCKEESIRCVSWSENCFY